MVAWRYGIYLLVFKKYFTRSLHSLVKYFSTLEKKFRIRGTQRGYSSKPLNIALFKVFLYLNGRYRHIFIP